MNNLKKYFKPSVFFFSTVLIYILILSSLHHSGLLALAKISTVNFVIMAVLSFVGGLVLGKKASKNGYLEGLKFGGILAFILFILNVLFYRHFDLYVVLYYLVLLVSSVIGSMIGINIRH